MDLVLLVDGSKSVRPQNFELVKRFVNQIVDFLDVSPEGTRVGMVQFSSRVRTEFPLGRYGTAAEVKQAVLAVEYMERGTMTGLALRHMVEHSFSEAQGARPRFLNVPRVGLVFTDGRSQDDVSVWAARAKEEGGFGRRTRWRGAGGWVGRGEVPFLRSRAPPASPAGIVMYAVGVGKAVEEELRQIASEPAELHVSYSPDFSTMTHLLDNLKGSICPGEHLRLGPSPSLFAHPLLSPLTVHPQPLLGLQPGRGPAKCGPGPAAGSSLGSLLEQQHFQLSPGQMD